MRCMPNGLVFFMDADTCLGRDLSAAVRIDTHRDLCAGRCEKAEGCDMLLQDTAAG